MSSTPALADSGVKTPPSRVIDMKLEVVVIPVADIERAKRFYGALGWRLDADVVRGASRLVQFTPPGSSCSIQFGTGITASAAGCTQSVYLVVPNLSAQLESTRAGRATLQGACMRRRFLRRRESGRQGASAGTATAIRTRQPEQIDVHAYSVSVTQI